MRIRRAVHQRYFRRIFLRTAPLVLLLLPIAAFAQKPEHPYRVSKSYTLGGVDRWDYLTLDAQARRLFISRSTHVMVVNADSGKVIGDIADTTGVHGIALAPELKRGFTSNGLENSVSIFNLDTLAVVGKVKVGDGPDAILYDPATQRVFTFNEKSRDATAVDAVKGTVIGTIPLGGTPEFAVSDGKGELFVNIESKSEMAVLDSRRLSVEARWPLAPCQGPTGLSIDTKNRRLFSSCRNKLLAVMDADNGKLITTLPIGMGTDGTAFDPGTGSIFVSCGEGVMTVVHEDSPTQFRVTENVATMQGARTLALDPDKHEIFLVRAQLGPPPGPDSGLPMRPTIVPNSFSVLVVGNSF